MVPYLIVLGVLGTVLTALGYAGRALRRRGGTGASALRGALAGYEEAMRATSYQAHVELRAQADRTVPVDAPDGFRPVLSPHARGRGSLPGPLRRGRRRRRRWWRRP
ncbi:hypothetical protein [Kitasatospora phosalacinea]|uniref:Secreted protein n=1 Tax=Kitasatospora phosalacinea TaxID=2065 RepID=A0A9W6UQX5_9ACTN|nr:hypothetical protein [Kitasatospora phosalacinea]GLW55995.1 hypothetical protein Kpho01_40060 [Kitasatospora phosalacinea]